MPCHQCAVLSCAVAVLQKLPDGTFRRGDINVLLLGDPSTAKSQFLKFASKTVLACLQRDMRSICHATHDAFFASYLCLLLCEPCQRMQ